MHINFRRTLLISWLEIHKQIMYKQIKTKDNQASNYTFFFLQRTLSINRLADTVFSCSLQKYELIKTEDIPNLRNSEFDPNMVTDIACNILSFLKSNATKEGHTYWLYKGRLLQIYATFRCI